MYFLIVRYIYMLHVSCKLVDTFIKKKNSRYTIIIHTLLLDRLSLD